MIGIFIQGLKDGEREIDQTHDVSEVPELGDEFFGEIRLTGKLRKLGTRFAFSGYAECDAELVCDRTLEKFVEPIKAEIKLSFVSESTLAELTEIDENAEPDERFVSPEDKEIDVSRDVREELTLNLPMKRLHPSQRDKSLEETFPFIKQRNEENGEEKEDADDGIDKRWDALKNLKIN